MRKIFTLLFALISCAGMLCAQNGTCGENLEWHFFNGTLTIYGTGDMYDYDSEASPWFEADLNDVIEELIIEEDVTSIGNGAFVVCTGLTSVSIPESLTTIGESAFSGCSGLSSLEIPSTVTSIGDYAFAEILNVVYQGSATGAPWGAKCVNGYVEEYLIYSDESKTSLVACLPTSTGNITIPSSVTSISNSAFENCSGITSVEIPAGITSIGLRTFSNCSGLQSVTIPSSVTSIGESAFSGCSALDSIAIPRAVTSIGMYAFFGCSSLTSIELPDSLTSIGDYAFRSCTGLTSISVPILEPISIRSNIFYGLTLSNITLHVPYSSISAYEAAEVWGEFGSIVELLNYIFVTFKDWNDTTLYIGKFTQGNVVAPVIPSREGYTFIGWDQVLNQITIDTFVVAQYEINVYRVQFLDWNNALLKVDSVAYLGATSAPANPTRQGHTFIGWDKDFSTITADIDIIAQYEINVYRVQFLDRDNSLIKVDSVAYLGAASAPSDPYHQGYTFIGWDKDFSSITADIDLIAQYNLGEEVSVHILFENGNDGSEVLATVSTIKIPAAPEITGFTFLRWEPVPADLADGLTIQAIYQADSPTDAPEVYTNPSNPAQKLIRHGNVYILQGEKLYTIQGQLVK
ncbi:MAG: leucine-rich repeat protein [Paludibacteraceae bacterium]|nr:leucine-rich repeat protein [Paludibacteraceae bacterium]